METQRLGLFRPKGSHAEHKVAFSELFFDLVFVYAITQSAHLLIAHFTPYGVFQGMLVILAVWWVWVFTTWVTNWLDPETVPVRLMLFVLMLLGMGLSIAIPDAFGKHGLLFALCYVTMQIGRTVFICVCSRKHRPELHQGFIRMTLWFAVSGTIWIIGALQEDALRTLLWSLAIAVEYVSASLSFAVPGLGRSDSKEWDISGAHMAERCGLLLIIALGESLLVTGNTFSGTHWDSATITAFVSAFVTTVAMWWVYFSLSAERASDVIARSNNSGHLGRVVYTYIHLLLIIAIVLVAVADEFVLAHPHGHTSTGTMVAMIGGTALYLLANILFKRLIFKSHPTSHYIGLGMLVALAAIAPLISPVTVSVVTTLVLLLVAIKETVSVMRKSA
ncbi:MAG: low temperature requirement protein A [Alcanivorax sp.]|uniref:low temperature requirement protein A n=1 Tax=Alcanivorax sp. TaxID=1872427 RepID=UPI003DA6D266